MSPALIGSYSIVLIDIIMIITKTPLRVSFCGGGSDIPSFYTKHGGCVISTAIDKYVYLAVHKSFYPDKYLMKYSEIERVRTPSEITHPIFRECLLEYDTGPVEITSMADVPAGTGLGSSSSFTVGLIHAIRAFRGLESDKELLASEACHLEIERLGEPIGKQDQYAAAYGGLRFYRFEKDGRVTVEAVSVDEDTMRTMESRLMMFYTGITRKASSILSEQKKNISSGMAEERQLDMCKIAEKLKSELEDGDVDALGRRLDESWRLKKTLASGISSGIIDECYETAMENGALGGKLLGAGGGGFILLYAPEEIQDDVRKAMPAQCEEMPFRFDFEGSVQLYNDRMLKGA